MLIRAAFRYRLPMVLLAGLLALLPFQYALAGFDQTAQYGAVSIAMLAMAFICFNKAGDVREDVANPASLPLNPSKRRAAIIVGSIFYLLPMPWIALHSIYFLGAWLAFGELFYLYNFGAKRLRLKRLLVVKNVLPAGMFAVATVCPYYFLAPDHTLPNILMSLVPNFFLMLAIDIMTDIRDSDGDLKNGIRTLPNTLGDIPAKIAALACIAAGAGYLATFYMPELPLMMAYFVMAALVVIAAQHRHYLLFQTMPFIWIAMTAVTILKKIFA